jgi:predicted Fe-Mo cluster-binding NifX family protein
MNSETAPTIVGYPTWNGRIAPVFDVARIVRLATVTSHEVIDQIEVGLPEYSLHKKTTYLIDRDVTVLICGAISRRFHSILSDCGIEVIPFITGDCDEILAAWMKDRLSGGAFAMPGRCRRRHQCRQRGEEGAG